MPKNARPRFSAPIAVAVALTAAASPASALVIVPTYTSNVTSLPNALQIETAVSYAIQQFEGMYANNMTLYMTVDTGSSGLALGNSFPAAQSGTYSGIRSALTSFAFTNAQISNVNNNWPANDPTGNNSSWVLSTSQAKAIGLHSANDPAVDGTYTFNAAASFNFDPFNRAISGQADFIGTTEHEISEIMGRNNFGFGTLVNGKNQYAPFNLNRYTAPGVRSFIPTQAGVYYSPDGGTSNLSPFNNQAGGDATDWLTTSPYTADSFNAFSNSAIANTLSTADEIVMETLGYAPEPTTLNWGSGTSDFLVATHWSTTSQGAINPHHGAALVQNSSGSVAFHNFTSGENFVLASNSDMGQTLQVTTGFFNVGASGPISPSGFGLLVNQDGHLTINSTGELNVAGSLSIGDDSSAKNSLANVTDFATVNVGTFAGTTHTLYVGNAGLGTFNQSGSSTVSTGNLTIGGAPTGSGLYFLSGTAKLNVAGNEYVGYSGGGVFDQTTGNHTVAGSLYVGTVFSGALGRFEIDGGTLSVGDLNVLSTASFGFIQTGGTVTVNGTLSVESENVHSANFSITGGSLAASAVILSNSGNFTMSAGSFTVTNTLSVGDGTFGNFTLSGGTLSAGAIFVGDFGTFTMSNGFLNSTLTNSGTFTYSGGSFFARLVNKSDLVLNANFAPSFGMENDFPITVSPLRTLTFDGIGSLDNESDITLSGTITGTGAKVNNGTIEFNGTISGSGQFTNAGTLTQTFTCTLALAGTPYYNTGTINLDVPLGHFFFINTPNSPSADRLINTGTINFVSGSTIAGSGGLENAPGGILNGSTGSFIQTAYFLNEGTINIPAGTFKITPNFSNLGTISLTDVNATLTGGSIADNGLIIGFGTVANIGISGSNGVVEASGGTLTVTGSILFLAQGTLRPDAGATLLLTGDYTRNTATINLNGGTLDNNNQPFTNQGQITGFGTLNTAGVTNGLIVGGTIHEGSMTLSNGNSIINSNINNVTTMSVSNGTLTVNGSLSGNGTISPTSATVTVAGDYTAKTYTSTNSLNVFQGNVNIPTAGTMSGGAGDQFNFAGTSFINNGTFSNAGALVSSALIQNAGNFTQTGTLIQSNDFFNTGVVSLSGSQTWNTGTNYLNNAGTTSFNSDTGLGIPNALAIAVNNGSTVYFAATQHLNALAINASFVTVLAGTLKTNALTFQGSPGNYNGILDLQDNKLILQDAANHAASFATLQTEIAASPSTAGISSSTMSANFAIAVLDNAVLGLTTFGGEPIDANSLLVAPELLGDANADGHVDLTDLSTILNNFGAATPNWTDGNFDNQPTIDLTDLSIVLNNFGLTNPNASALQITDYGLPSSAPEPASLAATLPATLLLLRRKNRSSP